MKIFERLVFCASLAASFAAAASAQVSPFSLKVETGPGLIAVTFSIQSNQLRVYLPDDVAPGERFSGAIEGPLNYIVELEGQRASARERAYSWVMPAVSPGAFVSLVLRDFRGRELARASLPVAAPRALVKTFRFPGFVSAGNAAPIQGPFDGEFRSTSFVIGGQATRLLAESVRKVVVNAPEQLLGTVPFHIIQGEIEKTGTLRSLRIETTVPDRATLAVSVKGLAGLQADVALKVDSNYIFIRPSDVTAEGDFQTQFALLGIEPNANEMETRLIFPQTPRDEVGLVLRRPRSARGAVLATERAQALKALDFDAFPYLQDLLADYELGSDAAFAMLASDERRALSVLFQSMPASGENIQRVGFVWFLSHYMKSNPTAPEAREAAVRVLMTPASSSQTVELALHTLGLTGSLTDLPLLEERYRYRNGWSGLRRIQDASEAAMARLGSSVHLENIRAELIAGMPQQATADQAMRLGQILEKAGFAGRPELLHAVCPHLADPAVTDIDVTWDPKLSAVNAMSAIVNDATPMTLLPRRTVEEWKRYCAQAGAH